MGALALPALLALAVPAHAADPTDPNDLTRLFVQGRPVATSLSAGSPGDTAIPLVDHPTVVRTSAEGLHDPTRAFRPTADFTGVLHVDPRLLGLKDRFWVLRLHFRVHTVAGAAPSYAIIGTSTNDLTTSSINVATRTRAGHVQSAAGTTGLIGGLVRSLYQQDTFEVAHENYLREDGVHGGDNKLSIAINPAVGRAIDYVELLPDSTLTLSRVGPDEMSLRVPSRPARAGVGQTINVPITLSRRGARPDGPVRVHVAVDPGVARLDSPSTVELPSLGSGGHVTVRVTGLKTGRTRIVVRAVGAYNPTSAAVTLDVGPGSGHAGRRAVQLSGLAVLLVTGGYLLMQRRRRRAPAPRP